MTRSVSDFKRRINRFVENYISEYTPCLPRSVECVKVIHDPVWGSNSYYPWEMAVLDSPLLQRLRLVKQTGLAHLVYPTARHSRFDHTLGVVSVVSRIVAGLNSKDKDKHFPAISRHQEMTLRMAAVLHDVGHCFFSHIGERAYERNRDYIVARNHLNRKFQVNPKPHEVMGYYIVTSKSFRDFLESILRNKRISPEPLVKLIDPVFIAEAIIGYWGLRPKERFLIEIINGPLDADKLDYIARDAQFAGLSVVYDFNRYLVTVGYHEEKHVSISRSKKRGNGPSLALRLPLRGATALEQILISKMMLYSYMYHHQKVVAAESMILEMFEPLSAGGSVECGGKTIAHPVDVLALTDGAVEGMLHLNVKTSDPVFARIGHRVSSRDLLKRALTISRLFVEHLTDSVESPEKEEAAAAFTLMDITLLDPTGRSEFRKALYQRTLESLDQTKSEGLEMCDVVVAWPKQPDVSEAEDMMVPLSDTGEIFTSVQKLFPLKEWTESYSSNQWKGYIFAPSGYRSEVRDAALKLISERFGVALDAEAGRVCGIPDFDTEIAPPP